MCGSRRPCRLSAWCCTCVCYTTYSTGNNRRAMKGWYGVTQTRRFNSAPLRSPSSPKPPPAILHTTNDRDRAFLFRLNFMLMQSSTKIFNSECFCMSTAPGSSQNGSGLGAIACPFPYGIKELARGKLLTSTSLLCYCLATLGD